MSPNRAEAETLAKGRIPISRPPADHCAPGAAAGRPGGAAETGVDAEAGAAPRPPEDQPGLARSQHAGEDVVRRKRLDARSADAEARLGAPPEPRPRPRGVEQAPLSLLVERGPRREILVARLLDRREKLRRQGDREPAIRRGDRAAARADGVPGRAHREAVDAAEHVGGVGAELHGVAGRAEREVEQGPHDERPPGRVRGRGRDRLRGEGRPLGGSTRILQRGALLAARRPPSPERGRGSARRRRAPRSRESRASARRATARARTRRPSPA